SASTVAKRRFCARRSNSLDASVTSSASIAPKALLVFDPSIPFARGISGSFPFPDWLREGMRAFGPRDIGVAYCLVLGITRFPDAKDDDWAASSASAI